MLYQEVDEHNRMLIMHNASNPLIVMRFGEGASLEACNSTNHRWFRSLGVYKFRGSLSAYSFSIGTGKLYAKRETSPRPLRERVRVRGEFFSALQTNPSPEFLSFAYAQLEILPSPARGEGKLNAKRSRLPLLTGEGRGEVAACRLGGTQQIN